MKYFVIATTGDVLDMECSPAGLPRETLCAAVGGDIEYVKVLFSGKVCNMVVNETGAVQDPPLPINARATAIYWNATRERKTGVKYEPLTMPLIHGTAILYDGLLP